MNLEVHKIEYLQGIAPQTPAYFRDTVLNLAPLLESCRSIAGNIGTSDWLICVQKSVKPHLQL